jgi:hypothetical protein
MVKLRGQEDYPIYFGAGPELLRLAGMVADKPHPVSLPGKIELSV